MIQNKFVELFDGCFSAKTLKKKIVFLVLFCNNIFSALAGVNYVVDNGGDTDDYLTYNVGDGTNTLRKCIRLVNNTPNGGTPHSITFAGPITAVTLTSSLPSISTNANAGGMTINGGAGPVVTIVGVGAYNEILNINTVNGVTVRNLRITNCAPCIHIVNASNSVVQGCHLGTNATSTGIQSILTTSTRIVQIEGSAATTTNNLIGGNLTLASERNLIVGAGQDGAAVYITGGASGNFIRGNYIGTATTGNALWSQNWGSGSVPGGNNGTGVMIENSNNNTIGGVSTNDRNIISGNRQHGIKISGSDNCTINRNYLGVGLNGTTALVNGNFGGTTLYNNITLENGSDNTQILNNTISNCPNNGIYASSGTNNSITIRGNYIGVDATGTSTSAGVMGNLKNGIFITNSTGHQIGGTGGAADRNIICNNGVPSSANNVCSYYGDTGPGGFWGAGILMRDVSSLTIEGNYIGVDVTGNTARGNLADGIFIENSSTTNTSITIGGATTASRNIICANGFGDPSSNYVWPCRRNAIKFYRAGGITIQNNYLGIAEDATTVLGNGLAGIGAQSSSNNNVFNNVFCGNDFGMSIEDNANTNLIYGNLIGVKPDGTTAAGNGILPLNPTEGAGILIQGSSGNRIGNSGTGQGNIISNNRVNILFRRDWTSAGATGNYIQNNIISNAVYVAGNRTDKSATLNAIYNTSVMGAGIAIVEGSNNNFIGGIAANEQNQIYNNAHNGVYMNGSSKNEIRQNSFYCNGTSYADASDDEKGINLDLTSGNPGNNSYGAPVVFSNTTPAPPNSDLNNLRGTAPANSIVEIFSTEPCMTCPPGGGIQTEGQIYRATVTANGSGNWVWTPGTALSGQYTATASEPSSPRNTSEFSTCGYITLPVQLIAFSGRLVNTSVQLDWITVSETNNSYFSIQKSTDGNSFVTIGKVNGGGNSNSLLNYNFIDSNPGQGIVYYRLIQVDLDGTGSISNIITINISANTNVNIYPNPTDELINVELSFSQKAGYEILVYNALGENVFNKKGIVENGFDSTEIDLSTFSSGVYFIQIQSEEEILVEKIIKK